MITDVAGVTVGHYTDTDGVTGCTVILLPPGTRASCAIPGSAPGTRETDALRPESFVEEVHAILLTGGSSYGLGATNGVMSWLRERGVGLVLRDQVIPIVPTAVIFDVAIGDTRAHPIADDAYAACEAASTNVEEGSVGAGTGATVAKWAGPEHRVKGGLGTASIRVGDIVVGAVVVCNAVGDVVDQRGDGLAAAEVPPGTPWAQFTTTTNTVLAAVVTNAKLSKPTCMHIARMGAAGIAQAVRPAHTFFDGDIVFCAATGEAAAEPVVVGSVVADVVAEALRRGVRAARGLSGVPGLAG